MKRGISIHIGVNHAATMAAYPLSCSENAAWKMAGLAFQAGYRAIHVLCGREATRDAVGAQLAGATRTLRSGDTLFVSYSGHGSRVPDHDGDERDGLDETWCLHDANLLDDDLAGYWRLLAPGVRAVVVSESCFGGGAGRDAVEVMAECAAKTAAAPPRQVYRSAAPVIWRSVKQASHPASSCIARAPSDQDGIRASVLMLAAAEEKQKAREGLYTRHLLEVWNGGAFRGTFCDLHRKLCERIPREATNQDPQILMLGAPDPAFPLEMAFHLDQPVMRGGRF